MLTIRFRRLFFTAALLLGLLQSATKVDASCGTAQLQCPEGACNMVAGGESCRMDWQCGTLICFETVIYVYTMSENGCTALCDVGVDGYCSWC